MANIIGPGKRKALETRRSPYDPGRFFCNRCSKPPQFVFVEKCRVYVGGLMRPGVICPKCKVAWYEQEEQPEKPRTDGVQHFRG